MADDLISWDEAVATLMKRTGKSRRQATAALTKACREGRLPSFHMIDGKRVEIPKAAYPLPPQQTVRRFDDDPSSLFLPLGDFQRPGGMSRDELLGELRSGRLKAHETKQTRIDTNTGESVVGGVVIDMQSAAEWMANPQTPKELVLKFKNSIDRKPN